VLQEPLFSHGSPGVGEGLKGQERGVGWNVGIGFEVTKEGCVRTYKMVSGSDIDVGAVVTSGFDPWYIEDQVGQIV
jgi:hypothetical protein